MFHVTTAAFRCHWDKERKNASLMVSIDVVTRVLAELGIDFRERIFTPFVTLFAFLSQVFEDDHSCRHAVFEVCLLRCRQGLKPCSLKTASYCEARARLPVAYFSRIAQHTASAVEAMDESRWRWRHGKVIVVDGTAISMSDSVANSTHFPKQTSQKNDVGFPIARVLALFSLSTGALIDLVVSPWKGKGSGELSLLEKLWPHVGERETLLGDCLYSSYFVVAKALEKKAHVVAEFRKSRAWRLKKRASDQIIKIERPARKNINCLSDEAYERLPPHIIVRIVHVKCAPNGFRARSKYILTTHLDSTVSCADIAELYKQRWKVELNLRSIKSAMGMDFLYGQTPNMVEKEIWVYMIGYNLIRMAMCVAGKNAKCLPSDISFRAVQQWLALIRFSQAQNTNSNQDAITMLQLIARTETVGNRPNRYEPRCRKRRPKNYELLLENRKVARAKLHKKHGRMPSRA